MSGSADDETVHVCVFWLVGEDFEALFDVYGPDTEDNDSILWITVRFHIIIIESFDGLVIDILKGLHAYFLAGDGVDVGEPGGVPFVDGGFDTHGRFHPWLLNL